MRLLRDKYSWGICGRKQDKLYFARELRRGLRMVFLLNYIDSIEICQIIDVATKKSDWWDRF